MQNSETGQSQHNGNLVPMTSEPKSPSSESSGSSIWDVHTSESHIFQGTQDWKPGSVRAMIGRHILVQGIQHRRYDRIHLYVNPKIERTMVKHDCLSEVANWTFIPDQKYDIKWTVFNHTFALPGIDFVCDPALDVDGVFGYDFVKEFSHCFFRAWPSGLVQPSRFCIANPLFHPINMDKVLRVYTAVHVRASVIGVGVFFGPEAGLNTWIPHSDYTKPRVSNLCAWETPELAEFDVLCTTLSTVLRVAKSGEYIQVEFHTSSQRLVSLMQMAGISSEGAELIVYHFDNAMRFVDLRKEFAMRNKAANNDCVRILPYNNEVSAKQAQRLAGLAAMCSPEPEDSLEDNQNFYYKFLAHRKSARVCKQLVKDTFRTILEDCLRDPTRSDTNNSTTLKRAFGQLEKDQGLYVAGEWANNGAMIGVQSKELRDSNGLPSTENGTETIGGNGRRGILYVPPQLRSERKGADQIPSASGDNSQHGGEAMAQEGTDVLVANAHVEAQEIRENATREAGNMLEEAYKNARIIRQFSASGMQHIGDQNGILVDPVASERGKILSEAYRKAQITIEKAEKRASHQAEIIMHEAIQKEKSMLAEAAQIINDTRKEQKRIIDKARVDAEREALVRISYAQGQADLKIRAADHTMKQAEEVGGKVHAEILALEEKKRLEEWNLALIRKAQVKLTAGRRLFGNINAETRTAIENTREATREMEKRNSDAKAQAEEIIENARIIQKEIHEKEKEMERIRADGEAELEKMKKDAQIEVMRETAELMEKARVDADAERERIKKDIEIAMRFEMENKEEEIRMGIQGRAKHEAKQIITQAKKKAEEFEKKMEALKRKTEEDCKMERRKLEELVSFQKRKEKDARDAAGFVLEQARVRADEMLQVAQGNLDKVPILGDVLGSALPMTPEIFLEVFFGSSNEVQLSAEGFASKLASSKEKFTLGQLVNHNVEGAKLFLEECRHEGRLAHEIELYVDEERDGRLKYKKGKRLLPVGVDAVVKTKPEINKVGITNW